MAELTLRGIGSSQQRRSRFIWDNLDIGTASFGVGWPIWMWKINPLRMIAGLEEITEGTLAINGKVVNDLPQRSGPAMVFQSYALYPHMSVRQNTAFS